MIWAVFAVLALASILLLTGRGAWLIAGYNTAGKERKSRYNEKKLCRVTGAGMAVISLMILAIAIWGETTVAQTVIAIDCVVMVVLMNTVCKNK